MRAQVAPHAVAEDVFAQPRLEHAKQRCALAIGDAVEGVVDIARAADRLAYGPRVSLRVEIHDVLRMRDASQPQLVRRHQLVYGLGPHPARKPLVEPQVVPPRHGDEISVPHVGELMSDHALRSGAIPHGCAVVQQQNGLPEGDETHVFHGSGREVRHADQIELGKGIGVPEIALEPVQDHGRAARRKSGESTLAARRDDASRNAGARDLRHLEIPDRERHQVAGQRLGTGEAEYLLLFPTFAADLGPIAESDQSCGYTQRNVEGRLEFWLVEARKGATGRQRLELCEGVPAGAAATRHGVVHAIQPARHFAESSLPTKSQRRSSRGEWRR